MLPQKLEINYDTENIQSNLEDRKLILYSLDSGSIVTSVVLK